MRIGGPMRVLPDRIGATRLPSLRARTAKATIAALLVVASLSLISASVSGAAKNATAPVIDRNAVIKVGYQYGPSIFTLDPAFFPPSEFPFNSPIYDRLTQTDPRYTKLRPGLATGWEFSKNGRALTVTLRTDVEFHDGSPVDAAAVKANIVRYKTLPGSRMAASYAGVQ